MIRRKTSAILLAATLAAFAGCTPDAGPDIEPEDNVDHVVVYYGCGFNNLTKELSDNVSTILESPLPRKNSGDHILIFEHFADEEGGTASYYNEKPGILIDAWKNPSNGKACTDTVMIWQNAHSASGDCLWKVLTWIRDNYPADLYSVILSSHGTGWLPVNEYDKGAVIWLGKREDQTYRIDLPKTRSFGQECSIDPQTGHEQHTEMDLLDLAEALPMHIDNLIFDACLMGGVEVAYQLRSKVSKIAFSQCEILAEGFPYNSLLERLIRQNNPEGLCEDFYNHYNAKVGSFQTGVISCVDCSKLEDLAIFCSTLIPAQRQAISELSENDVQRYYSGSHKWYFDMEDILRQSKCSDEDLTRLEDLLGSVVTYKNATERILDLYDVTYHCGLSMYLPSEGYPVLDEYYRTLDWNKTVHLVE